VLKGKVADLVWDESSKVYCTHTMADVQISIKDDAIVDSTAINIAKMDGQIIKEQIQECMSWTFLCGVTICLKRKS
jgi:hypothetical protein